MIATALAFLAGVVVGAIAPPLLLWALFRHDRRVLRRRATEDRARG